jgi:hypothetical protein
MNFDKYTIRLQELYDNYFNNENYKTIKIEFNEVFLNLIKTSDIEKKYFSSSPLDVFIIDFNEKIKNLKINEIDFDENEYIKKEYLILFNLFFKPNRYNIRKDNYYYTTLLNDNNYNLHRSILKKRIEYLEKFLYRKGIETIIHRPYPNDERINVEFKKHINIMVENDNLRPITFTPKGKPIKSLLLNGNNLNIKDRYRILNKILNFDKIVHPLNIGELEKYQLLAYILGCDKDNARKLMCGSHDAKDTDLTSYFNELGLKK